MSKTTDEEKDWFNPSKAESLAYEFTCRFSYGGYLQEEYTSDRHTRELTGLLTDYADQRVSEALSSQWVSVKERLPERNNLVLTYRPDPHSVYLLEIDYWSLNSEKNADHFSSEYTHWQPLPSPPLNH